MSQACSGLQRYFIIFVSTLITSMIGYEEKPIVVVVPSYNNMMWYKKNLDSIFCQNYSNYRVIYIDDCSSDGTGDLVQKYLEQEKLQDKCFLVKNEVRYGQLFNRYKAIHSCDDEEIVVLLDGDDWFIDENVLAFLNHVYCQEEVLLTVGNACKSKNGQKIGYRDYTQQELEQFGVRQLGFRGVHPRTFYAGLFKMIKAKDLMMGGKFFTIATDVAFMLPLFEMAEGRYKYIHDILYVYNNENPINLFKSKFERQIYFDLITRNREPYKKLEGKSQLFSRERETYSLNHLLFMENEQNLGEFFAQQIENGVSFESYIEVGNGNPYRSTKQDFYFKASHSLAIGYPLSQVYQFRFNFKERLLEALLKCTGEYLLVSTEKVETLNIINFRDSIEKLETTGALGIFFGKSNGQYLKEHSYDFAPWNTAYNLYGINLWAYQEIFSEVSDCYALLVRTRDFIDVVERLTIFHPNYYTLLAAIYSTIREDTLWLVARGCGGGN